MSDIYVQEGVWHHLAVVWDDNNDTVELLIDGVVVHSGSATTGFMPTVSHLQAVMGIGGLVGGYGATSVAEVSGGDSIESDIDGPTIWGKALSATEILRLFTASGSPIVADGSSQTAAKGSSFRVAPSHILAHVPFDDDESLSLSGPSTTSSLFSATAAHKYLGSGFRGRYNIGSTTPSGATNIYLDLATVITNVDANETNKTITWADHFVTTSGRNLYRIYNRATGASMDSEIVQVSSFTDGSDLITTAANLNATYDKDVGQFQRNLIADGDFEIPSGFGTSSYWADVGGATTSRQTGALVSQGQASAKIVSAGSAEGTSQDLRGGHASTSGGTYDSTDWVAFFDFHPTMEVSGSGAISFLETSSTTSTTGLYYVAFDQKTEWGDAIAQDSWNQMVYVHTGNAYDAENYFHLINPASGTAYYDNAQLLMSEIVEGNFHLGTSGSWSASGTAAAAPWVILAAGGFGVFAERSHVGARYGTVTLPVEATTDITQTFSLASRGRRRFLATVYAKLIGDGDAVTATLAVKDDGGTTLATVSESLTKVAATGDYTKLSVLFAADTDAGSNHDMVVTITGDSGDVVYLATAYVIEMTAIPGEVRVMPEEHAIVPTKDRAGAQFVPGNQGLSFSTTYLNPNEAGFLVRFRPQFSSDLNESTPRPLFDWQLDVNNGVRLQYVSGVWSSTWEQGGADRTITPSTATAFAHDALMELSGWFDPEGRSIGGTTYYGKLFLNGTEIGSTTSSCTAMASSLATAYIGSDSSGNSAEAVIDEVYLMTLAPTDGECKGFYVQGDPLHNDNRAFSWTADTKAGDHIRLDTLTQTFEAYNAPDTPESSDNAATRTFLTASTGVPPSLKPFPARKGWVVLDKSAKEIRVTYRKEFI